MSTPAWWRCWAVSSCGLTLCTATCKPTDVVRPILEEQGLAPYFSFVGGASMDESRDNKTDVIRHVLAQPVMQGKRVLMVATAGTICRAL